MIGLIITICIFVYGGSALFLYACIKAAGDCSKWEEKKNG